MSFFGVNVVFDENTMTFKAVNMNCHTSMFQAQVCIPLEEQNIYHQNHSAPQSQRRNRKKDLKKILYTPYKK